MSHPAFGVKDHHAVLNCQRLPAIPKEAAAEEYGARQNLLSCLNTTLMAEGVLRQQGPNAEVSPVLSAILKSSLQPLWSAFCLFANKRIGLREKATKGCFRENQLVQKLVETNIFSETLFDNGAVEEVFQQAERQAKSLSSLLNFRQQFKRKRSSSKGQRTPKSQRTSGYQKPQSQTPRQQGNQFQQRQSQQGQSTPGRQYPSTPRGRGYRGRGRGGRSPGTPQQQTPGKQNF